MRGAAVSYRFLVPAILAAVSCSAAADTAKPAASQRVLFSQLARQCGRNVHPDTLQAVARVESSFNPFVIGVVGGRLAKQPRSFQEAVQTAERLHAQGRNFSMGLMQVNRHNLKGYGLDYRTVFDPCANVRTGAAILADCFKRAGGSSQADLHKAFSCYYSGNFRTGFRADFKGQPPYVVKILNAARQNHAGQTLAYSVPAVNPSLMPAAAGKGGKAVRHQSAGQQQAVQPSGDAPSAAYAETVSGQTAAEPAPVRKREAWDAFGDF